MKIVVDYERCESNGLCEAAAPEIFEIRSDDNLYLLQEEVSAELLEAAQSAVESCPRQALRLAD